MSTKAIISIDNKYSEHSGDSAVVIFPKRRLDKPKEKEDKEILKDINVLLYFMRHQFLTALSRFQDGLGESVGHFLEQHPEWARAVETMRLAPGTVITPAPEQTPPLWAEAQEQGDTPPAFIQRHYQGRTRVDLYRRDPELLKTLYAWTKENRLPEGFDLQPPLWPGMAVTPPHPYVMEHYLGQDLSRADIKHIDPGLHRGLYNISRVYPDKVPEGFDKLLPTKSEKLAAGDHELKALTSLEMSAIRRMTYRSDKQRTNRR